MGTDQNVLVVTHSANIMVLKSILHKTDFAKMSQYKEKNAAYTIITSEDVATMKNNY